MSCTLMSWYMTSSRRLPSSSNGTNWFGVRASKSGEFCCATFGEGGEEEETLHNKSDENDDVNVESENGDSGRFSIKNS